MAKSDKIFAQIGDEQVELTGNDKSDLLAFQAEQALLEAEYKAKQDARESAIKKLADIAGLTKEELASIL